MKKIFKILEGSLIVTVFCGLMCLGCLSLDHKSQNEEVSAYTNVILSNEYDYSYDLTLRKTFTNTPTIDIDLGLRVTNMYYQTYNNGYVHNVFNFSVYPSLVQGNNYGVFDNFYSLDTTTAVDSTSNHTFKLQLNAVSIYYSSGQYSLGLNMRFYLDGDASQSTSGITWFNFDYAFEYTDTNNYDGVASYTLFDFSYVPSGEGDLTVIYQEGYNQGYNKGQKDGYSQGSTDGYNSGYDIGYTDGVASQQSAISEAYSNGYSTGYDEGSSVNSTAVTIFSGILQVALVPINFFLAIFNFEILGINLSAFIKGIFTIAMTIIIIRTIFGGKGASDS